MKEFFNKVKTWVLTHKVVSIVIAAVLVAGITLAIVLPLTLGGKKPSGVVYEVTEEQFYAATHLNGKNFTVTTSVGVGDGKINAKIYHLADDSFLGVSKDSDGIYLAAVVKDDADEEAPYAYYLGDGIIASNKTYYNWKASERMTKAEARDEFWVSEQINGVFSIAGYFDDWTYVPDKMAYKTNITFDDYGNFDCYLQFKDGKLASFEIHEFEFLFGDYDKTVFPTEYKLNEFIAANTKDVSKEDFYATAKNFYNAMTFITAVGGNVCIKAEYYHYSGRNLEDSPFETIENNATIVKLGNKNYIEFVEFLERNWSIYKYDYLYDYTERTLYIKNGEEKYEKDTSKKFGEDAGKAYASAMKVLKEIVDGGATSITDYKFEDGKVTAKVGGIEISASVSPDGFNDYALSLTDIEIALDEDDDHLILTIEGIELYPAELAEYIEEEHEIEFA